MKTKKINNSYVEVDGEVYEKITNTDCETIDLDLDTETMKLIDQQMKTGNYVNHQDVIRTALRELIKHIKDDNISKEFDGKKLLND